MSTKTHRELYPDQYTHSMVGRRVIVWKAAERCAPETGCSGVCGAPSMLAKGTVTRVVASRFGELVILDDHKTEAWSIDCCEVL